MWVTVYRNVEPDNQGLFGYRAGHALKRDYAFVWSSVDEMTMLNEVLPASEYGSMAVIGDVVQIHYPDIDRESWWTPLAGGGWRSINKPGVVRIQFNAHKPDPE